MKRCFVCEKELKPIQENKESIGQSWGGGQVRLSFSFGSKYDWLGYRLPIHGKLLNKVGKIPVHEYLGSKPNPKTLSDSDRAVALSSCTNIIGDICDDCFKKKAHLLKGYEQNTEKKLDLLVN